MKSIIKRLAILTAAVSGLFLVSCINLEQDVWINADGSGRVKVDMGISKQMLEMAKGLGEEGADPFADIAAQKKKLEANENVKSVKITSKDDEKYRHAIYDVELKDITKLNETMKDILKDSPAGGKDAPDSELKIVKLDSGNYKVTAKVEGPDTGDAEGEGPEAAALAMMKQMFGDAAITIRVHGPPVKHNGKLVEDAAVWKMPIVDLISGGKLDVDAEVKPK
jgi:hypothetical protein